MAGLEVVNRTLRACDGSLSLCFCGGCSYPDFSASAFIEPPSVAEFGSAEGAEWLDAFLTAHPLGECSETQGQQARQVYNRTRSWRTEVGDLTVSIEVQEVQEFDYFCAGESFEAFTQVALARGYSGVGTDVSTGTDRWFAVRTERTASSAVTWPSSTLADCLTMSTTLDEVQSGAFPQDPFCTGAVTYYPEMYGIVRNAALSGGIGFPALLLSDLNALGPFLPPFGAPGLSVSHAVTFAPCGIGTSSQTLGREYVDPIGGGTSSITTTRSLNAGPVNPRAIEFSEDTAWTSPTGSGTIERRFSQSGTEFGEDCCSDDIPAECDPDRELANDDCLFAAVRCPEVRPGEYSGTPSVVFYTAAGWRSSGGGGERRIKYGVACYTTTPTKAADYVTQNGLGPVSAYPVTDNFLGVSCDDEVCHGGLSGLLVHAIRCETGEAYTVPRELWEANQTGSNFLGVEVGPEGVGSHECYTVFPFEPIVEGATDAVQGRPTVWITTGQGCDDPRCVGGVDPGDFVLGTACVSGNGNASYVQGDFFRRMPRDEFLALRDGYTGPGQASVYARFPGVIPRPGQPSIRFSKCYRFEDVPAPTGTAPLPQGHIVEVVEERPECEDDCFVNRTIIDPPILPDNPTPEEIIGANQTAGGVPAGAVQGSNFGCAGCGG